MKNWKLFAQAQEFGIPETELDRAASVLEALEASFRPLTTTLKPEIEPAVVFLPKPEERA